MLDERWIRALHVETMRERELHEEREPHVLFQASTIAALLDGAYDGDLTFAELAEHGDLGLGTLNGLDGEMIALDGRFYRAAVDGTVAEVAPGERTPFAVVTGFAPTIEAEIGGPPSTAWSRRGRRRARSASTGDSSRCGPARFPASTRPTGR